MLGAYLCCRAVLPGMVERGHGRIVNTGSGASYLPMGGGPTAYGASKAALGRFGELLAGQVGELGIAVFTISPGLVRTEMTEVFGPDLPGLPPSSRHGSSARSRADARTGSPGATSTPSTTTSMT